MKYQAPKSKEKIEQVFVRLPKELQRPFWEAVNKSGTRPKELAVDMIKHCLRDMESLPVGSFVESRDRISG